MDAYEAIMTRRSIRAYTAQAVSGELIQELLAAAMSAPSASNRQPWHFVVITERRQLDALTTILPYGQMLKQAPLAIVVCGDRERQPMDAIGSRTARPPHRTSCWRCSRAGRGVAGRLPPRGADPGAQPVAQPARAGAAAGGPVDRLPGRAKGTGRPLRRESHPP